jgi:hypothetical protein
LSLHVHAGPRDHEIFFALKRTGQPPRRRAPELAQAQRSASQPVYASGGAATDLQVKNALASSVSLAEPGQPAMVA